MAGPQLRAATALPPFKSTLFHCNATNYISTWALACVELYAFRSAVKSRRRRKDEIATERACTCCARGSPRKHGKRDLEVKGSNLAWACLAACKGWFRIIYHGENRQVQDFFSPLGEKSDSSRPWKRFPCRLLVPLKERITYGEWNYFSCDG